MTVVLVVLLAVGGAAVVTMLAPKVYTASSQVYLSADNSRAQEGAQQVVIGSNDLTTYVAVLNGQSPALIEPFRESLGLKPGEWVSVSGSVGEAAPLLDLTANASSAELAARAANELGPQLAKVAPRFSSLLQATGRGVVSTTVSPATTPSGPSSPNLKRNLMMGAFAGLLLGVGLAFIRHLADTKVRADADIRAVSNAPILAHLPVSRSGSADMPAMRSDPHGMLAEATRRLRTNLLFVDVTTAQHSVVVTSPMPGEGKTSTAVNLSLAMAAAGQRVLLIDGDLRKPSVARMMSLDDSVGLTSVLLGRVSVEDAVQRFADTTLDVLPAGQIPPNPSELLGSVPMEMLFHELKSQYDFVVVDSPPIVPVVDAVVLEKLAGNLLLIVAADRTPKRDLVLAFRALSNSGASVSGVALNMVSGAAANASRYGYYREHTEAAEAALESSSRRTRRSRGR
jgi:capsular exopolysaccharide synthesis family protein